MSYCRFSSEDWASDVYAYESADGIVVHVAARRHVFRQPLPEPVALSTPPTEAEIEAMLARWNQVSELLHTDADLVPIDHPLAGADYTCDTPAEALDTLLMLRGHGFRVPDAATRALAEEAAERSDTEGAADHG